MSDIERHSHPAPEPLLPPEEVQRIIDKRITLFLEKEKQTKAHPESPPPRPVLFRKEKPKGWKRIGEWLKDIKNRFNT